MTVGPRIVFTRFATALKPSLAPWREHIRRVTGLPEVVIRARDAHDTGVLVVWRLVSANNRELARGARLYEQFEDAANEVRGVVAAAGTLEVSYVSEHRLGAFGWSLSHSGAPEVVCSRWYDNDRDRRHSVEAALRALPIAALGIGARAAQTRAQRRPPELAELEL